MSSVKEVSLTAGATTGVTVAHPPGCEAERRYAAEVLLRVFLGLDVNVVAGSTREWQVACNGQTLTFPDVFFSAAAERWLAPESLPSSAAALFEDPFGTAFFMLTRYEEAVVADRDEHGRFPAGAAFAVREHVADRAVVNDVAATLWSQLQSIAPRLERRARPFRDLPSHDVDHPWLTRKVRGRMLRGCNPKALLPRDLYDTFDFFMGESERRGLRTAFYFIADESEYSLDDPRIRRLLRRIHERGHEIGFHAGYGAFGDVRRTRTEFERLVAVCEQERVRQTSWGGRAHYLRWSPASWAIWDEIGLDYDASVGFSDRPGFRAGACLEYPSFDLRARRQLRLRERPLVVMDSPALARIPGRWQDRVETVDRLRALCRAHGGDFTSLWHNSWVTSRKRRRLFRAALGATGGRG